jgi:hypothetical protein
LLEIEELFVLKISKDFVKKYQQENRFSSITASLYNLKRKYSKEILLNTARKVTSTCPLCQQYNNSTDRKLSYLTKFALPKAVGTNLSIHIVGPLSKA